MVVTFFHGETRKRWLWLTLGLGALSTLIGWLVSLRYPGDSIVTLWFVVIGGASFVLAISVSAASAPEIEIPPSLRPYATMLGILPRQSWEALATVAAVMVILQTMVLPPVLVIYLTAARPQTAKSIIPLSFMLVAIAVGLGVSWLYRSKDLGALGVCGIVGVSVTIIGGLGFAIAELL